jgi:hypothetical protein
MGQQTYLEEAPALGPSEDFCGLCGQELELAPDGLVYYAGMIPVGHLCPECLQKPRGAAGHARQRAREIRALARRVIETTPRSEWLTVLQLAHARASYWDGLATEVEKRNAWSMG